MDADSGLVQKMETGEWLFDSLRSVILVNSRDAFDEMKPGNRMIFVTSSYNSDSGYGDH
jgi:hypothetical protein